MLLLLGESHNTSIFLRVLTVISSTPPPRYLKLSNPLITWGGTSNSQCLPRATYFRKFWWNPSASKSSINEQHSSATSPAALPAPEVAADRDKLCATPPLCVTRKIQALLSRSFSTNTARRTAERHSLAAEQQAAVSTALSVRLEYLGAKGRCSPLQPGGKILSLKYMGSLKTCITTGHRRSSLSSCACGAETKYPILSRASLAPFWTKLTPEQKNWCYSFPCKKVKTAAWRRHQLTFLDHKTAASQML